MHMIIIIVSLWVEIRATINDRRGESVISFGTIMRPRVTGNVRREGSIITWVIWTGSDVGRVGLG